MSEHLKQYVQYIRNTAQVPLKCEHFDEDWEPVGPMVRRDLVAAGWITEAHDGLRLTDAAPATS